MHLTKLLSAETKLAFFAALMVGQSLAAAVNPDGSFGELLPILTPAGRGGIQPNLAINYNSNSGNGTVGVGFSFGLPAITRMNFGNGITYTSTDTFIGPEGRLINLSGIYHAENETWS